VVAETGKRLARQGHPVCIITRRIDQLPLKETRQGMQIFRYENNSGLWKSLREINRLLRQLIREYQIDILVVHQPLPALPACFFPTFRNMPRIREFHGPWHEEYRIKKCGPSVDRPLKWKTAVGIRIRRMIDRYVLTHVNAVRVLSEYMEKAARNICTPRTIPVTRIPGGVDTYFFSPGDRAAARRKLSLDAHRPILFTVRNHTPRMGLDVLITAMEQLRETLPEVLLLIGGDGFLRKELGQQVQAQRLQDHVQFTGYIEDALLPDYYRAANIFILPTQTLEGFGLVTLEAMACGVPVLATPLGGTREVLGLFGRDFLMAGSSSSEMAASISQLLARPEECSRLGETARKIAVTEFSWEACTHQYISFLEQYVPGAGS
jgi:glycosyltransferase involved in cell wall biosynthesis